MPVNNLLEKLNQLSQDLFEARRRGATTDIKDLKIEKDRVYEELNKELAKQGLSFWNLIWGVNPRHEKK
jgi:hypothetical protein